MLLLFRPSSSLGSFVTAAASFAILFHNVVASASAGVAQAQQQQQQSPFLKEILLGRCYDLHNNNNNNNDDLANAGSSCPDIVGSIMSILEGHLDPTIEPSNFDEYVKHANFDSPPNKAMYWLQFLGDKATEDAKSPHFITRLSPSSFVTPEDTVGAKLMKDLTFCGTPVNGDTCNNIFESKAYWSFWEAAYAEFAKRVTGDIHIVIESHADIEFFIRSAVPYLQQATASENDETEEDAADEPSPSFSTVTLLSEAKCTTKSIMNLVSILETKGFVVNCKDDSHDFIKFQVCTTTDQDPMMMFELCTMCTSTTVSSSSSSSTNATTTTTSISSNVSEENKKVTIKKKKTTTKEHDDYVKDEDGPTTKMCNGSSNKHHHHHFIFWMIVFACIGYWYYNKKVRGSEDDYQSISSSSESSLWNEKFNQYNSVAGNSRSGSNTTGDEEEVIEEEEPSAIAAERCQ